MPLPTKRTLMIDGVIAVLASCTGGEGDIACKAKNWLKLPDVRAAAEKDAQCHLAWGRSHGHSLDNCRLPHTNLFRVFNKYLQVPQS